MRVSVDLTNFEGNNASTIFGYNKHKGEIIKNAILTSVKWIQEFITVYSLEKYDFEGITAGIAPRCGGVSLTAMGEEEVDLHVVFDGVRFNTENLDTEPSFARSVICQKDYITKRAIYAVSVIHFDVVDED